MKIVVATYGSHGEAQPMPALSPALISAGQNDLQMTVREPINFLNPQP